MTSRAGVRRRLIVYLFGTQFALWKAVVSAICAEHKTSLAEIERKTRHVGAAAALSEPVSAFVRFTARRPELHRMLTIEGGGNNERLQWWIDAHVRDFHAAQPALAARDCGGHGAGAGVPGAAAPQAVRRCQR
jgi:TetR/AcrR family transcriptional regulator